MSKKPSQHLELWSYRETCPLSKLAREGASSREAAKQLGRTPGATRYKSMVEHIRFRSIKQPAGSQAKAQRTIKAKARKRSEAAKKAAATRKRVNAVSVRLFGPTA